MTQIVLKVPLNPT